MIGKIISHYKILEKLGEGGMGVVYKAQDIKLQRLVALKFLPPHVAEKPEEKARFIQEAQAASALSHPNVTTIYGIEESSEGLFISMEFIEGHTLKKVAEKESPSIKRILELAIQVSEGLNAAHRKGIVHRDIKSDNIMVTQDGQVKIMDFGLARLEGVEHLTETGSTLGTAAYMSPEQAQGEEVDQRSDIFSFGVVLYELLTGRLPFRGEHIPAIIYSILNENPEPVARYKINVPEGLQRIVDKALAKDREERYQHIDDLLADLRHEKKSLEYVKTGQIPAEAIAPKPKRKLLPIVIPASVVFILVLLFLILKPFKFEIGPEKKATAEENKLAIMYFENMANPADSSRLGEIIANLLITDLTESPYLKVVSSQRLYDILKLLGKEGVKRVDKAVATQVAEKAQAKWMLLGSILQVEPRMVITTQLVEVKNGEVKKSQHIAGEPKEDVFSLVDKLTAALKKDLSLPAQAEKEETPKVADVTTHSQEAYRFYVEGMDYTNKYYWTEAEKSFKKALEYDSTFAMAYFRLSILAYYTGNPVRKGLSARAMKYSDKVSQKEKLYIQALEAGTLGNDAQFIKVMQKIVERYPDEKEAFLWLGQAHRGLRKFDESIHYLSKAIELDSLYKEAYNILAYAFDESGDFEKSIWAINRYIELAPDEPNPYDSRADLYAWNGKIDLAVESYKKAIEMEPDFYMSISKLGNMYLFKRDYAKAESCYEKLCASSDAGIRAEGRLYLAYIPAYQGRFDNALKVLDDGLVADRMDKIDGWQDAEKHFVKSRIYQERKNSAMALQEIEKYMEIYRRVYLDNKLYGRQYYARLLAENKEFAKAEEVAQAVKKDVGDKDPSYWLMIGNIELERGNLEASIAYLEKAATAGAAIGRHFSLAQAYLQAGRLDESVAEFEKVLTRYDEYRASSAVYNVKTYYLLGLAYEKSGWNKKAIEKYEEFLDIWKNADPGILEVTDAKERLRKLKANSRQ